MVSVDVKHHVYLLTYRSVGVSHELEEWGGGGGATERAGSLCVQGSNHRYTEIDLSN